jgi:hypothetical protein
MMNGECEIVTKVDGSGLFQGICAVVTVRLL